MKINLFEHYYYYFISDEVNKNIIYRQLFVILLKIKSFKIKFSIYNIYIIFKQNSAVLFVV